MESVESAFSYLIEENKKTVENLLDNDYAILKLESSRLRFYHGLIDQKRSEKLLLEFQKNFCVDSEIFLIRDESPSKSDFILSILHQSQFFHYRLEHLEDAYFKFFNGFVIHGLDHLVEYFAHNKDFLPCSLKHFIKGYLPPDSTRIYGNTLTLHRLTTQGSVNLLRTCIQNPRSPQINIKDSNGKTALHIACQAGNFQMIEFLLKYGASVKIRDKNGKSPLDICCAKNDVKLLKLLIIGYKSSVNGRSPENSWSSLHVAAYHNSPDVIYELVTLYGAILDLKTQDGLKAEDLAKSNNSLEAYKVLKLLLSRKVSVTSHEDWLHEKLNFTEAVALLDSVEQQDGLFLVIKNEISPNNFNLIFYYAKKLNNFEISFSSSGFQIGCGTCFNNLEELIESYCREKDELPCVLLKSLNKNGKIKSELLLPKIPLRKITLVRRMSNSTKRKAPVLNLPVENSIPESRELVPFNFENEQSTKNKLTYISANDLRIVKKIGQGEFGIVYEGRYSNKFNKDTPIAIKQLKSMVKMKNFLREANILSALNHPCIVKIYGICYEQQMIALELLNLGALEKYLRLRSSEVTVECMKRWSAQIANGMMHLESRKLIHRDLATRNILLSSYDQVKISDFGMTRKLEPDEVYYQNFNSKIPFKWYPLESIESYIFTNKSDVWSFGVTIWEIFSLGESPYGNMNFIQVSNFIKQGFRLRCPAFCPIPFYDLMLKCWCIQPENRPFFINIVDFLQHFN